MFTLLPYPDFDKSARVFDSHDLVVQIEKTDAIMSVLHQENDTSPYDTAPSVLMWKGYEPQLCMLGFALCKEFRARTALIHPSEANFEWHLDAATCASFSMRTPPWFGDLSLHRSHQSYMMRTNSRYISFFDRDISLHLPIIWPVLR